MSIGCTLHMLICGHHIIIMCGAFELLCICEEIAIDENINSRSRVSFVVRGVFFFNFILSFVLSIAPNTAYLQFCYYSIQELITITSNCHQQSFLIHPLSLSLRCCVSRGELITVLRPFITSFWARNS